MIVWLAPMDGITDFPFRTIVDKFFTSHHNTEDTLWKWTEFMSANGYMINPSRLVKHLITNEDEHNIIAQIYWGNIETLVSTAQDIEKKYPSFMWIELNIWCPSPKVLSCGAWAGMMNNKNQTLSYIKTLSESINMPFSIKTRVWLREEDKKEQFEFIVQASQYCHMMGIHGRTYKQWHQGEVDRDFIYALKKECHPECKIIWNGWVLSYQDIDKHRQHIDGVMIGQAAIHSPRILTPHEPTWEQKKIFSLEHFVLMLAYECYMTHTREAHPEISDQLALNRKHLHLQKKYNPDSDESEDIPEIQAHDYIFPMPSNELLDEYKKLITQQLTSSSKSSDLSLHNFTFPIHTLRSGIDCRKYFFGYIKWHSNSKWLKQELIQTKHPQEIYAILQTI